MSFLVDLRNKEVESAHTSAIGIFGKAIKKFETAIQKANANIAKNDEEKNKHIVEVSKRTEANALLKTRISTMQKSVDKIYHIIGE